MLYECMSFYEAVSGVNQTVGIYVKGGRYLLLIEYLRIENLRAKIVDEEEFRSMLENWRPTLEEDMKKGRADYLRTQK